MATKKPTAKQIAARKLFAQRAKSGAFARKATRKKNPLTRVKRNSPSMATGKAPSKRLVKRRAKTAKAPAGYYANPAVNAPSRATGNAPTKRLKARRKKTNAGPAGYYANPAARGRFQSAYVEDDGGFSFGMDDVTPVTFVFSTKADASKTRGAYRSFGLPKNVIDNDHFQAWARGANGRVISSLRDLRATIKKLASL